MTHDIIVKQHGGHIDVATAPGQCRRCAHRRHVAAPINGAVELAGSERFSLDEFARKYLTATKDPRKVVADIHTRYSAQSWTIALSRRATTPGSTPCCSRNGCPAPHATRTELRNQRNKSDHSGSWDGELSPRPYIAYPMRGYVHE
jgi:hypothetical protein